MKKAIQLLTIGILALALGVGLLPGGAKTSRAASSWPPLITCCPVPWIQANADDGKDKATMGTYGDVEIIDWTTRTFIAGSTDASSMQQPFNFWYDIAYMQLFGKEDPNVDYDTGKSDWKKIEAAEFTEALNAYHNGTLTLDEFNQKMKSVALKIREMVNNAEGTKVSVNYIIKAPSGGIVPNSLLYWYDLLMNAPVAKSNFVSDSGKEALFLDVLSLESKTTETVKAKKLVNKLKITWTSKTNLIMSYKDGETPVETVLSSVKNNTGADGFQIRYATDKSMKKNVKIVKAKPTETKKTVKAKKGKTYYVQTRTYNKHGDETYYGAWSKKVKVKA